MNLKNDLGNREIKEVIEEHPKIGEILDNYEIGCIKCSIGTCYVKDVVAVHVLGDQGVELPPALQVDQREMAEERFGEPDLGALLRQGHTWTVS